MTFYTFTRNPLCTRFCKLSNIKFTICSFYFPFNSNGKLRTANGFIGLPHLVSQGSSCQLNAQNCYLEVTLGCSRSATDKMSQLNSNYIKNLLKNNPAESPAMGRGDEKGSSNHLPTYGKTFIYPAEAVLVPVLQTSFSRSSLRRYFFILLVIVEVSGSC